MGRLCGVSQQAVWKWVSRMKPLPPEHVLTVEEATGVSRHDLRPDIYPREDAPLLREGDSLEGVRP
ncbi:MAG: YdaS family helix-turn-helix protein [Pseudomonadota bacterium]|nr:YdaS family helix-turn-helix protein [Pseudomonadota bacterium]